MCAEAPDVHKVICVSPMCSPVQLAIQGEKLEIKTTVKANILYISSDGCLQNVTVSGEATAIYEYKEGHTYNIRAFFGKDINITITATGVDVKIPVMFNICEISNIKALAISSISYDETKKLDLCNEPSIVIHRVMSGDTLWKLAKRFSSSIDLIAEANNLENPDMILIGEMLIVPKKR